MGAAASRINLRVSKTTNMVSAYPRYRYTCTNCADGPIAEVTVDVAGHDVAYVFCPECGENMEVLEVLHDVGY